MRYAFEPVLSLDDKGDMSTPTLEVDQTLFKLHQRANYWQTMHGRAVEWEQYWKGRSAQLEAQVGQHAIALERQAAHFEAQLRQQATVLEVQAQQIEALKAQVAWLQQQVFGRKSEGSVLPSPAALWAPEDREGVPVAGRRAVGANSGAPKGMVVSVGWIFRPRRSSRSCPSRSSSARSVVCPWKPCPAVKIRKRSTGKCG